MSHLAKLHAQLKAVMVTYDLVMAEIHEASKPAPVMAVGLVMEPSMFRVLWNGEMVRLTSNQYETLACLVDRPGHVKSRQQIMDYVYPAHDSVDERTIDSMIKKIRRSFRLVDPAFAEINTVYGVGYVWEPEHGGTNNRSIPGANSGHRVPA
jgi:two-component system response regulator ChvI